MVNQSFLHKMKPSTHLINFARGDVVDEVALYTALTEGVIAGPGVDVMVQEPPAPDHPLLQLDNFLIPPIAQR